jgi:deoxyribose-phosphate aldolase
VETLGMTRKELVELVEAIAQEAVRELGSSPSTDSKLPTQEQGGDVGPGSGRRTERLADARRISLTPDVRKLAALMDHTLLRPEATRARVEQFLNEASLLEFATVCVNPAWVPLAVERLRGSEVKVASVAGFPLGATSTAAKRAEAHAAILAGAAEIDMVMNIGAMKSGDVERVENDIRGVLEVCRAGSALLKVILENAYLSDQEKVAACQAAARAGADYVKTSTGFGPSGAKERDVRLMRETVGPTMGVKAAGGIRTLNDSLCMLNAGANRLGTSASVDILAEASVREQRAEKREEVTGNR